MSEEAAPPPDGLTQLMLGKYAFTEQNSRLDVHLGCITGHFGASLLFPSCYFLYTEVKEVLWEWEED